MRLPRDVRIELLVAESEPFRDWASFDITDGAQVYEDSVHDLAVIFDKETRKNRAGFADRMLEKSRNAFNAVQSKFGQAVAVSDFAASARVDGLLPLWCLNSYPLGLNAHNARSAETIKPANAQHQLRHTIDKDGCAAFSTMLAHWALGTASGTGFGCKYVCIDFQAVHENTLNEKRPKSDAYAPPCTWTNELSMKLFSGCVCAELFEGPYGGGYCFGHFERDMLCKTLVRNSWGLRMVGARTVARFGMNALDIDGAHQSFPILLAFKGSKLKVRNSPPPPCLD